MNCHQKCRLFSQRRRHRFRQKKFITILFVITSLFGFFVLNRILDIDDGIKSKYSSRNQSLQLHESCSCSKSSLITFEHGECFFDQPICYPGFAGQKCEIQLNNESYRSHCPPDVRHTEWTSHLIHQTKFKCSKSASAQQEWNSSCLFLCFYHRLTGIIQIPKVFWQKSLQNELAYWKDNPMTIDDRLYEHVHGFHGYKILPLKISSIVEIGAGPFTQIQYLLTPFRSIKRITLIEPNAINYMKLNNCAYRGGHLRGYPVSIIPESIEYIMKQRRQTKDFLDSYSIVVSINVIEHVHDALEYFRGIYDLIEENGLLIFHERWFDTPRQADCVLSSAEDLHPIRITKWMIDIFLEQFEPLHVNYNRSSRQIYSQCHDKGIYFIGRKKSNCKYIYKRSA